MITPFSRRVIVAATAATVLAAAGCGEGPVVSKHVPVEPVPDIIIEIPEISIDRVVESQQELVFPAGKLIEFRGRIRGNPAQPQGDWAILTLSERADKNRILGRAAIKLRPERRDVVVLQGLMTPLTRSGDALLVIEIQNREIARFRATVTR